LSYIGEVEVDMKHTGWQNWSGSVRCNPATVASPRNVEELAQIVGDCGRTGRRLRVAGSGHSFTPLVETDDIVVSLKHLTGLDESVGPARDRATALAGTRLKELGQALFDHSLAMENLGDIDEQSISGAISTGTHGTGIKFGSIATQVIGLDLVTVDGKVVECSEESNPELFKAAQVSLGALGVIARVTLRVQPSYRLRRQSRRALVADCLANVEKHKQENRNFEFFWFPYSGYCQAKFLNQTTEPPTRVNRWSRLMENRIFLALSEWCRIMPRMCRPISRFSAWSIPTVTEVNYSQLVYPTPRLVRFQEMEYNLPAAHFLDAMSEIRDSIERSRFAVHFPIECRFVQADDIWLSPATGRDSCYIAVHMYRGMPYQEYFAAMESIFQKYEGRPHWGKMHTMTAAQLRQAYPRWDDFLRLRGELDPRRILLNPYLERLFGLR
jgi:FAD-linked oxidoreductase